MSPHSGVRSVKWVELGLGLVVIAAPLAFLPASSAPFVDIKLVVILGGALAIWRGVALTASPLSLHAFGWVLTAALASVVGVDRWWSVVGPERSATGLVLLGTCAFLLVTANRIPKTIRERIPLWFLLTCTGVAAVSLGYRFWPDVLDRVVTRLSLEGGTMGHPAFLAGLMAAGIVAAVGATRVSKKALVPMLLVMTSALALSTKRVGWLAVAVGLMVALLRARLPRPRMLLIVGTVGATLLVWTTIDALVDPATPVSGAGRFTELRIDSARARIAAIEALGRSWGERPIFGWGPGNTWSAFVSSATGTELREAGRGYGDAHNIFVEAVVTTGALGLSALMLLIGLTIREMLRVSSAAWEAGGAAALAMYHLLQPLNVVLTPLLFLLAGLACCGSQRSDSRAGVGPPARRWRKLRGWTRGALGVGLASGLALSIAVVSASVLEQYGESYNSEWSLRTALRLTPGRVTAAEALALRLALDGRSGDVAAAREAVVLAKRTVMLHPWSPGVRLMAADVHILLNRPHGAWAWIGRHLDRFPRDVIPRSPGLPRSPP